MKDEQVFEIRGLIIITETKDSKVDLFLIVIVTLYKLLIYVFTYGSGQLVLDILTTTLRSSPDLSKEFQSRDDTRTSLEPEFTSPPTCTSGLPVKN